MLLWCDGDAGSTAQEPFRETLPGLMVLVGTAVNSGVCVGKGVAVLVRVPVGPGVEVVVGVTVPVGVVVPVLVGVAVGGAVGVGGGRLLIKMLMPPEFVELPSLAVTISGLPSASMSVIANPTGCSPSTRTGCPALKVPFPRP